MSIGDSAGVANLPRMRCASGMPAIVWMNGTLCPAEEVQISPFDHGITVGNGIFETMISHAGMPFAFTRHYRRLAKSAEAMGLSLRAADELKSALQCVLTANKLEAGRARIRITVTGGPAPLGSERGQAGETTLVAASALGEWGATEDVIVVSYTRNEQGALAGLKTTSYGENVVALARAREGGAGEAVFANTKGELCEGTGSNIFLVSGGKLVTPPLSSGCLPGVTRALVLELCEREGVEVMEKSVPVTTLHEAAEAFLTSTTREVQPIRAVDGLELPRVPGVLTSRLREAFQRLVERESDP